VTRAELLIAIAAAERDRDAAQWEYDQAPDFAHRLTVADMRRIEERLNAAKTRLATLRFELRKLARG
jgi:thioredoxin-like negative regulator of GroEL